jgi:outer membrane receptor protein involved in Fe transport
MNQETMSRLSIAGNITYTRSQIELSKTEFDSRTENAREGQTISATRDMAGQAPYIINGGILFQASENKKMKGLEAGLFYNVQGQTLLYAGIADRPDIYTVPFHSLNFNAGISVGKEQKIQLSLKIDNLLNSVTEIVYKSYMADDQLYRSLQKGRTVQVKFSYKFF